MPTGTASIKLSMVQIGKHVKEMTQTKNKYREVERKKTKGKMAGVRELRS